MKRKQNKVVLIVALVLVLVSISLLIVVAVGSAKLANGGGGSSSSGGFSGGLNAGVVGTRPETTKPTLKPSSLDYGSWEYNENEFHMAGLSFYARESDVVAERVYGIRFSVHIPASLKAEMEGNENVKIGAIVAPVSYFNSLVAELGEDVAIDWKAEFTSRGMQMVEMSPKSAAGYVDKFTLNDGKVVFLGSFSIINLKWKNVSIPFTSIFYVTRYADANDTEGTREYATYREGETYATFGRSMMSVCGQHLNEHVAGIYICPHIGRYHHLLNVIDAACDIANGIEPSLDTLDGTKPVLNVPAMRDVTLTLEQGADMKNFRIEPELDVPTLWMSSDERVVTVDDNGKVYAQGYGTAKVTGYIAGQSADFNFTVTGTAEEIATWLSDEYKENYAKMTGTDVTSGTSVQLTFADLAKKARELYDGWTDDKYNAAYKEPFEKACELAPESEPGQDIQCNYSFYVFTYAARAALSDVSATQTEEYANEYQILGHTFYSRYTADQRTKLLAVANFNW